MSGLQEIVLSFCVGIVAIGAVSILVPHGPTERPMKALIGIFMISLLITPILKGNLEFDIDFQDKIRSEELRETINNQVEQMSKNHIELLISNILQRNKIEVDEISVIMDICDDGSIFISQISISANFENEHEMQDIKKVLEHELGFEVELTDEGG